MKYMCCNVNSIYMNYFNRVKPLTDEVTTRFICFGPCDTYLALVVKVLYCIVAYGYSSIKKEVNYQDKGYLAKNIYSVVSY